MTNVSNSLEDAAKAIFELLPHNGTMGSLRPAWDQAENGLHRDEARRYARAAEPFFSPTPSPQTDVVGPDPHEIGRQIMGRIAKIHPWKEQCVSDIAQAITSERNAFALREAQLRYISSQWPETSAGKYARAALDQSASPQMNPECEECHGSGEVFGHADDCNDDLCALNGDLHSCSGKVEPCGCTAPQVNVTMLLQSKADTIRTEYQLAYGRPCDCSTTEGALQYGRAQGLEIAADIISAEGSADV